MISSFFRRGSTPAPNTTGDGSQVASQQQGYAYATNQFAKGAYMVGIFTLEAPTMCEAYR